MGALAQLSLIDPYSFKYRSVELAWTHGMRVLSVLAIAASVCTLVSVTSKTAWIRTWNVRLLTLSTIGLIGLALLGFPWAAESEERGGDWVGLGIIIALIVGVLFSSVFAFLCGLQLVAVRRMRG
jgi:ABC-type phosphate/phosphonate transport system permease subunit